MEGSRAWNTKDVERLGVSWRSFEAFQKFLFLSYSNFINIEQY